jgi:hypothetical protein
MDDKEMKVLLGSLEDRSIPPAGLKESMLRDILVSSGVSADETGSDDYEYKLGVELGFLQRLFFEKPLRAAGILSASLSAILWAIFRDGYVNLLAGFIGTVAR